MHQTSDRDYAEPLGFATVYAALGPADEAFHWLERAAPARTGIFSPVWVNGDPRLDPLRNDPRLTDLLGRMGLVQTSTSRSRVPGPMLRRSKNSTAHFSRYFAKTP